MTRFVRRTYMSLACVAAGISLYIAAEYPTSACCVRFSSAEGMEVASSEMFNFVNLSVDTRRESPYPSTVTKSGAFRKNMRTR